MTPISSVLKKNMLRFLFLSSVLVLGTALVYTAAFAAEYNLVHMVPDDGSTSSDLKVVLNDHFQVMGFKYIVPGQSTTDVSYQDLKDSAVLLHVSGYDIMKLTSNNFDPRRGGTLEFSYIRNGFTGKVQTLVMELVYVGNRWVVREKGTGNAFNVMKLVINKHFGLKIGIRSIEVGLE